MDVDVNEDQTLSDQCICQYFYIMMTFAFLCNLVTTGIQIMITPVMSCPHSPPNIPLYLKDSVWVSGLYDQPRVDLDATPDTSLGCVTLGTLSTEPQILTYNVKKTTLRHSHED